MNFKEYQEKSRKTAIYPNSGENYVYPTLGLSGEAGEVAEKIKKVIRDKKGIIDEETREEIKKRTGRCFVVCFSDCFGIGIIS
jgi:NTP pyrophosphatase (non-canonical NTP hydrolase)